jgi:hypothetical protein
MIVSRLVEVRLTGLAGQAELFLELLACHTAFEDAMELLCIDVKWGFLGVAGASIGRLLVLLTRRELRRTATRVVEHGLLVLDYGGAYVGAHATLRKGLLQVALRGTTLAWRGWLAMLSC